MIYKFDRYLLKTVFIHFAATLFFLIVIDFIVQFSDQSHKINGTTFPAYLLIYTLFLDIPNKIIEYAPASILVATIMGLGQLSAQNEITVIRISGVSRFRLSLPPIILAFVIGIFITLLGETIAPIANHKSETIIAQAEGQPINIKLKNGVWIQNQDDIIHIDKLNSDGSLSGLSFYSIKADGSVSIQKSKSAKFQQDYWLLSDNQRYRINQDKVQDNEPVTHWKSRLTPKAITEYAKTDNASTIRELVTLRNFLKANLLNSDEATLKLWQRILVPLTTVTMVLLALPFAFNTKRNGFGGRLVIGIMLGVAYYFVQGILSKAFLLFNWPPTLGAMLPILIFIIPPIFLLRKK